MVFKSLKRAVVRIGLQLREPLRQMTPGYDLAVDVKLPQSSIIQT